MVRAGAREPADLGRATLLGPTFAQARSLAAVLVRQRTASRLVALPDLPTPDILRALLPLRWATELARGATAPIAAWSRRMSDSAIARLP